MPQIGQIIPYYRHPHNMTVINDNTEIDDSAATESDALVRSIFVIASEKGRDGELLSFTDERALNREFGDGNIQLYGQPYYNAHAFLQQRDVRAYVMRVAAENATHSNIVIAAHVKPEAAEINPEGEKTKEGKLTVVIAAYEIPDLRDSDDIYASLKSLESFDAEDENGDFVFPLFAINSSGRGAYGDSFRTRIVRDFIADADNPFINYRTELYEFTDRLSQRESVTGALNEDAVDSGVSYFLGDLFDNEENSNGNAGFLVNDEAITALHELYVETVQPDVITPVYEFDFLYGKTKEDINVDIEGYVFDYDSENFVILDSPEGVQLVGGSDGDFEYAKDEIAILQRQEAIDAQYIRAFAGEIDPTIRSKRRTPAELLFDAGYSDEVKREIISLLLHRYDCYGHLDAGIITNVSEALAYADDAYELGDRVYGREFQHYQIRDPFTNKRATVTYTYHLASSLPSHIVNTGFETPFTGEDATILTGHIKNSLKPVVDADDVEIKEQLYNNRMNYVEAVAENVFVRGTQSTSLVGTTKNHWSDLNEENNMRVLLNIKRALEDLVLRSSYSFAEEEDRAVFTESAQDLMSYRFDGIVRSHSVEFAMNPYEEERSILHCYVTVVFRSMSKRSIIEIDVNPRA